MMDLGWPFRKFRSVAESHWNSVFTRQLSKQSKFLIASIAVVAGVLISHGLHRQTGHIIASVDMLIVTLIATYSGPIYGIASGLLLTVMEDFLFIGDFGKIFNTSESIERFFVLAVLTIIISLFNYSLRSAFESTVSAKKDAEEAKREAELAVKSKSVFLATVSHEIRTPLNGIIGLSDLLKKSKLSPEDGRFVSLIHESGKTLLKIINDILDFSKIESGHFALELSDFSFHEIVAQVVNTMKPKALEKSLYLSATVDPSLPRFVHGDASRISQVLFNLIGNGIKFTSVGSVMLTLKKVPIDDPKKIKVLFSVNDTGQGIPIEIQNRLFQPFTQFQKPGTTGESGTGLGLSICQQILKSMGASIYVESSVGRGSRFSFELDLLPATDRNTNVTGEVNTKLGVKYSEFRLPIFSETPKTTVLVAEDNPTNQITISVMLERMGANVLTASNGKEALDMILKTKIDLILMDCQMPMMDGFQATSAIRKGRIDIPIIAMTANASLEDQKACWDVGMNGFVSKPLTIESLANEIVPLLKPDSDTIFQSSLVALESFVGRGGVTKVVQSFLTSLPESVEELNRSLESNDLVALHKVSHRLKSSSLTVGATGLHKILEKLEKSPSVVESAPLVKDLLSATPNVKAQLLEVISHFA